MGSAVTIDRTALRRDLERFEADAKEVVKLAAAMRDSGQLNPRETDFARALHRNARGTQVAAAAMLLELKNQDT